MCDLPEDSNLDLETGERIVTRVKKSQRDEPPFPPANLNVFPKQLGDGQPVKMDMKTRGSR